MKTFRMTLARHNELKAHYRGKATGIQNELRDAGGFNINKDWSMGIEKETGDFIFMQAEPKVKKAKKKSKKL